MSAEQQSQPDTNVSNVPTGEEDINLRRWFARLLAACGLTQGDRLFAMICGTGLLLLLTAHWWRISEHGRAEIEIDRQVARTYDFRLDMNHATWVEWMQLEGIGKRLAHSIVNDRELHGPYRDVEELTRVRGIGPKTLDRVRPYLAVPEPNDHVLLGQSQSDEPAP